MADQVLLKFKRGAAGSLPTNIIDGTIYLAQNATLPANDNTGFNIFYVDALNASTGAVTRYKLDAWRAGYATSAGSASVANQWASAHNFQISDADGTNTGTAIGVTGGAASYTLPLPSIIKAALVGNVTGNVTGNLTGTADYAKKISTSAAIGSASIPVYIAADGTITKCTSISLTAAAATKFSSARTIALTGDVTGSASADGSSGWSIAVTYANTVPVNKGGTGKTSWTKNQLIYATDTTTLGQLGYGTANYILCSGGNNNAPVWTNPTNVSVGKAAALTSGYGDASHPVYINSSGVPTQITSVPASLISGVIDISHIPKSAQERFVTIGYTSGQTVTQRIQAAIDADDLQIGDTVRYVDENNKTTLYYLYATTGTDATLEAMGSNTKTMGYAEFAAGAASYADSAGSAGKWTSARNFKISDQASTPHVGPATSVDGSASAGYTLKLPTTIAANIIGNLTGTADVATKLGTANVGSSTLPIYLAAGVPTACSTSLAVSITGNAATATKWANARNFTIKDYSETNAGAATSVNGTAAVTLKMPENAKFGTVTATTFTGALSGNATSATTATTADKLKYTLSGTIYKVSGGTSSFSYGQSTANVSFKIDARPPQLSNGAYSAVSNVFDDKVFSMTSIAANSWETVAEKTALSTGSWLLQIAVSGGDFNAERFTGVMSWYDGTPSGSDSDEILLHAAGSTLGGSRIYARTQRTTSGLKLQILSESAITTGTITVFCRRLL